MNTLYINNLTQDQKVNLQNDRTINVPPQHYGEVLEEGHHGRIGCRAAAQRDYARLLRLQAQDRVSGRGREGDFIDCFFFSWLT